MAHPGKSASTEVGIALSEGDGVGSVGVQLGQEGSQGLRTGETHGESRLRGLFSAVL